MAIGWHRDDNPGLATEPWSGGLGDGVHRESLKGSLVFPNWELGGFLFPVFGAQWFLPLVHT